MTLLYLIFKKGVTATVFRTQTNVHFLYASMSKQQKAAQSYLNLSSPKLCSHLPPPADVSGF